MALCIETNRDHFDQVVEASLRRDLPIITTPHAKAHLTSKGPGESFTRVFELDVFQQMLVNIQDSGKQPRIRVTAMPGKHVPTKMLQMLNDIAQAVSIISARLFSKFNAQRFIQIHY
jgi:hypothetical protein